MPSLMFTKLCVASLQSVCDKYGVKIEDAHCAFSDSEIGDPNADATLVTLDRVCRTLGVKIAADDDPQLLISI